MLASTTGSIQAAKMPDQAMAPTKTGSRAILTSENEMFSTGIHIVPRRPVSAASWMVKIVQQSTAATNKIPAAAVEGR